MISIYAHRSLNRKGKYTQSLEAVKMTILRLRYIVLLVYYHSCRKRCKNWWPGISRMKHWGISPTSITICLQTRKVHRNHNAPCDYTYTGNSGKQEVTLELS
jgi:hypothetical protein